jgi:transposase-like protein
VPLFESSLVAVIWNKVAWLRCPKCGGTDLIKRGWKSGHQRYVCRTCGRYCTDSQAKFGAETKAMAIEMSMNSMGIRAIGRVPGASPAAVLKWIRKDHALLKQKLAHAAPVDTGEADVIEMDEIYTYVQKTAARGNLDGVQPPASACRCIPCGR